MQRRKLLTVKLASAIAGTMIVRLEIGLRGEACMRVLLVVIGGSAPGE